MIGSPPSCRPECVSSSECDLSKACKNNRCVDPCSESNICAINSNCRVISHAPICSCKKGFEGDPFVRCYPEERKRFFSFLSSPNTHFLTTYSLFEILILFECSFTKTK